MCFIFHRQKIGKSVINVIMATVIARQQFNCFLLIFLSCVLQLMGHDLSIKASTVNRSG